ncbi:galactose-1-phosphate uridylyltransferase, partial [Vibrio parahaemolyticus]
CYLCPGNIRTGGDRNPDYPATFVFPNDFPAVMPQTPAPTDSDALFTAAPARGTARVICYSPDHSRTLPEMDAAAVRALVDTWAEQS